MLKLKISWSFASNLDHSACIFLLLKFHCCVLKYAITSEKRWIFLYTFSILKLKRFRIFFVLYSSSWNSLCRSSDEYEYPVDQQRRQNVKEERAEQVQESVFVDGEAVVPDGADWRHVQSVLVVEIHEITPRDWFLGGGHKVVNGDVLIILPPWIENRIVKKFGKINNFKLSTS